MSVLILKPSLITNQGSPLIFKTHLSINMSINLIKIKAEVYGQKAAGSMKELYESSFISHFFKILFSPVE